MYFSGGNAVFLPGESGQFQNLACPCQASPGPPARSRSERDWHHEAVVLSWMRQERAPRLLLRRLSGIMGKGILPADAARTQHSDLRATARWVEIFTGLYEANFRSPALVSCLINDGHEYYFPR
jgi:hypothetical protein